MSFGELVTVGAQTANGLFTADSAEGGTRSGPFVRMRATDVATMGVVQGSVVTVRGSDYVVEGVQPDGLGTTRLILTGGR